VETQTAFPIRRFLKIQEKLRIARPMGLNPLVWFFACQGETWRLYAATIKGNQVVIFRSWITG
jgi:hypothetical protein